MQRTTTSMCKQYIRGQAGRGLGHWGHTYDRLLLWHLIFFVRPMLLLSEWVVWGQKINLLDRIQNQYSRVHHRWKSIILFRLELTLLHIELKMWCPLLSCKLKSYLYTCIKLYLYLSRQTFRNIRTHYFTYIQKISCLFTGTRPQWKFFCRSILKDLIGRVSFSIHLATFFPLLPMYLFLKKKEGSRRTSNHQMPESFAGMKSSGTGTSWLLCFSIAHSFDVKAAAAATAS